MKTTITISLFSTRQLLSIFIILMNNRYLGPLDTMRSLLRPLEIKTKVIQLRSCYFQSNMTQNCFTSQGKLNRHGGVQTNSSLIRWLTTIRWDLHKLRETISSRRKKISRKQYKTHLISELQQREKKLKD